MVISSLDNFKIKEIKKLKQKKYRDIHEKFLVEGKHIVEEAYKSGLLLELFIEEKNIIDLDIPKTYVSKKIIKNLSDLDTPSIVIGICKKKEQEKELGDKILFLDNIQDPGNLGTIIRSSYAFNVDNLVISEDTVDIYNYKTIRASQGMIFKQKIARKNIVDTLTELKNDYTIYGTDVVKGKSLDSISLNKRSVIIIGNEGQGITTEVKNLCDEFINININPDCESLNASVAASIILYEFNKVK